MIEQMGSGMGKPDPSPNLSLYFSPVNYLVVEMLDISVLSSTSKAINVIVHGQGRLIGSLYSSPNPACCYDLWESLSEMERVHYFPWLFSGGP